MINQFEVPMYITEALPEIAKDLKEIKDPNNIYQAIHVLLDYTFHNIKEHNLRSVKKCFKLTEKLYEKGNSIVKCAIENVFIFSFSQLPVADTNDKKKLMGLLPGSLYTIYLKQVLHCGI